MCHFNQFVFDMRGFLSTVIISGKGSCANQNITDTDFTSAIRLSVIACKAFYKKTCVFVFTI